MNTRIKDIQAKLIEMTRKLKGKHFVVENLLKNTNLPFKAKVMGLSLAQKFSVPQMDMFDRSREPVEHIEMYKAHMIL